MTCRRSNFSLDDFLHSRTILVLACAWGLAEAMFFFIVPDVLLTFIACRLLRPALKATIAALLGALAGGALMFAFGLQDSNTAQAFLDHIPAIDPALIARVSAQVSDSGLLAVLLGPMKGIPYKIYAVEWGSRHGNIVEFLLISVPARYVRFFLATVAARGTARLIQPLTHHRAIIEITILGLLWIGFYSLYFWRFGW